jgi:hypothetical protein
VCFEFNLFAPIDFTKIFKVTYFKKSEWVGRNCIQPVYSKGTRGSKMGGIEGRGGKFKYSNIIEKYIQFPIFLFIVIKLRHIYKYREIRNNPKDFEFKFMKGQEVGENCIMKSFITCTLLQV